MTNLRAKFTRWYYRKGYRMSWVTCPYADGVSEMIFRCPWWLRPLVTFLFSPSIYYAEEGFQFGEIIARRMGELKGNNHDEHRLEDSEETT